MSHRVEVYMDSYNSKPIVKVDRPSHSTPLSVSIGDDISKEDWRKLISGSDTQIELNVRVQDIRHLFWDSEDVEHALTIKVELID